VRVHADVQAGDSARSIGAAAYAAGVHIAFGHARYRPDDPGGRALLAHELAHVTQHASAPGPLVVARQTVEQYETGGIPIERERLQRAAEFTYWERKLQDSGFVLAMDTPTTVRLKFGEEHDAVLSVVWQVRPSSSATASSVPRLITIPPRVAKGSRGLTYRITFRPPAAPAAKGSAEVKFIAEGAGAAAVTPERPSTSFVPKTQGGYRHGEFPNGDVERYWHQHRDEQRQVFHWIENAAPSKFDQIVTAKSGSGAGARAASFHITGTKDRGGKVSDLVIVFLGAVAAERRTTTADYHAHDFADAQLEEASTVLDPIHRDKLGRINGLDSVPEAERGPVKFAISQYFRSNATDPGNPRRGTRNAEVDAIVPILDPPIGMRNRFNTNRRALYTFRFKSQTNDVEVVRVGEAGKDVSLAREGSLADVSGFAAHAVGATEQDKVTALSAWLERRYPAVSLARSSTVADLEKDVTAKIRAGSGDPAWFEKNYGIMILDETAAAEWLAKTLGFKDRRELQDLKPFTPEELRLLELALERMSDPIVGSFRNVRLIRQRMKYELIPGSRPPDFRENPDSAGDTITITTRTIRIFDAAMRNIDALFLGGIDAGGRRSAVAASSQTFAHELGHVVARLPGVQRAFDALVRDTGISPITWYAGTNPPKELFPEAFSLFYLDPQWLHENWPDLFNFFDALDRTGPPAVGAGRRP
jgi:hypothetical protein